MTTFWLWQCRHYGSILITQIHAAAAQRNIVGAQVYNQEGMSAVNLSRNPMRKAKAKIDREIPSTNSPARIFEEDNPGIIHRSSSLTNLQKDFLE